MYIFLRKLVFWVTQSTLIGLYILSESLEKKDSGQVLTTTFLSLPPSLPGVRATLPVWRVSGGGSGTVQSVFTRHAFVERCLFLRPHLRCGPHVAYASGGGMGWWEGDFSFTFLSSKGFFKNYFRFFSGDYFRFFLGFFVVCKECMIVLYHSHFFHRHVLF